MAKQIVPIKNIEPVVVDIKTPGYSYKREGRFMNVDLSREKKYYAPKKWYSGHWFLKSVSFAMIILFAAGGFLYVEFKNVSAALTTGGKDVVSNFRSSLSALTNLEPGKAGTYLEKNKAEIENINTALEANFGKEILMLLGNFIPTIKEGLSLFGKVSVLNVNLYEMTKLLQDAQSHGFNYFEHDGAKTLTLLSRLKETSNALLTQAQAVKNSTGQLKTLYPFFASLDSAIGDDYLTYSQNVYSLQKFLDGLMTLLSSESDKHILLLFQNPSEIRPGGGFIGSYADLTIRKGQMTGLDVRDIYDPDGQLFARVIPPRELQGMTHDWGARDANWFFDFPTSAKTVISFLEQSKIYSERSVTFDAAIALNIRVIESLLEVTGPIVLPDYNLTISKDNLLLEVQKEVESGNDNKAGHPKRILTVLAPMLLEKLNSLDADSVKSLFEKFSYHTNSKDIMFFAKSDSLQQFFIEKTVSGDIYNVPQGFWGNYLAVVNANIAGGKSDAFVNESVDARVDIDTNGGILTDVKVIRTHTGNMQKDSWWKTPNKDYIQIFTNDTATPVSLTGGDKKQVLFKNDYTNAGYTEDTTLSGIEASRVQVKSLNAWKVTEFGKSVIGTWFTTNAGTTNTLEYRYQMNDNKKQNLGEGDVYSFIFDRQSGVKNKLNVTVFAPVGFVWEEGEEAVYTYTSDDPPARVAFTLTLMKNK